MNICFLDFETCSDLNLKNVSVVKYCSHSSTKILGCAVIFNYCDPVFVTDVEVLYKYISSSDVLVAHNVSFDSRVLDIVAGIKTNLSWIDTMDLAKINSLPRSLDKCAEALLLPHAKQKSNSRWFTNKMSWTKDTWSLLVEYALTDVKLCASIYHKLIPSFSFQEQRVAWLTRKINNQGILIDMHMIDDCLYKYEQWKEWANSRAMELTKGKLKTLQQTGVLTTILGLENIQKETLLRAIDKENDPIKKELMNLRLQGAVIAHKKFEKMRMHSYGCRLYDVLYYYGAITGRFTSEGVQLQNIKRGLESVENLKDLNESDLYFPEKLSNHVRHALVAEEGNTFLIADYSQIEARVCAWISGQNDLVEDFRNGEKVYEKMASRIYGVPLESVTKQQRFIGKSAVLGCGYGMGARRFADNYGMNLDRDDSDILKILNTVYDYFYTSDRKHILKYAFKRTYIDAYPYPNANNDSEKETWIATLFMNITRVSKSYKPFNINLVEYPDLVMKFGDLDYKTLLAGGLSRCAVRQYRLSNPNIISFWSRIEEALKKAINRQKVNFNGLLFYSDSWRAFIELPSGRKITYPYPSVDNDRIQYYKVYQKNFIITDGWNGKICEHICSGIARDLMTEAMIELDKKGFKVRLSVHDEVVVEVPKTGYNENSFKKIFTNVPAWANGLPISAEYFTSDYYTKG